MRLNNMECVVETAGPGLKLHEHSIAYGDGLACCYIAAPERPGRFQIRIKSDAFIASGVAAFVHIDGKYQSNKFMPHLGSSKAYDKLDLVFRGKEVLNKTHTQTNFSRKAWTFDDLDTDFADMLSDDESIAGAIVVRVHRAQGLEYRSKPVNKSTTQHSKALHMPPTASSKSYKTRQASPNNVVINGSDCVGDFGGLFDGPSDDRNDTRVLTSTHDDPDVDCYTYAFSLDGPNDDDGRRRRRSRGYDYPAHAAFEDTYHDRSIRTEYVPYYVQVPHIVPQTPPSGMYYGVSPQHAYATQIPPPHVFQSSPHAPPYPYAVMHVDRPPRRNRRYYMDNTAGYDSDETVVERPERRYLNDRQNSSSVGTSRRVSFEDRPDEIDQNTKDKREPYGNQSRGARSHTAVDSHRRRSAAVQTNRTSSRKTSSTNTVKTQSTMPGAWIDTDPEDELPQDSRGSQEKQGKDDAAQRDVSGATRVERVRRSWDGAEQTSLWKGSTGTENQQRSSHPSNGNTQKQSSPAGQNGSIRGRGERSAGTGWGSSYKAGSPGNTNRSKYPEQAQEQVRGSSNSDPPATWDQVQNEWDNASKKSERRQTSGSTNRERTSNRDASRKASSVRGRESFQESVKNNPEIPHRRRGYSSGEGQDSASDLKRPSYRHAVAVPEYIDKEDQPYAVFVFKYRSKGKLETIVSYQIEDEAEAIRKSIQEMSINELNALPKAQLIELLRAQNNSQQISGERAQSSSQGLDKKGRRMQNTLNAKNNGDWNGQESGALENNTTEIWGEEVEHRTTDWKGGNQKANKSFW